MYARPLRGRCHFRRPLTRRATGRPARKPECLPEQLAVQLADLSRVGGEGLAGFSREFGLRLHCLVERARGRELFGKRLRVLKRLLGVVAIGITRSPRCRRRGPRRVRGPLAAMSAGCGRLYPARICRRRDGRYALPEEARAPRARLRGSAGARATATSADGLAMWRFAAASSRFRHRRHRGPARSRPGRLACPAPLLSRFFGLRLPDFSPGLRCSGFVIPHASNVPNQGEELRSLRSNCGFGLLLARRWCGEIWKSRKMPFH